MPCEIVDVGEIADSFREEIVAAIKKEDLNFGPKLVGFLSNSDPTAKTYSALTAQSCLAVGIHYELRHVDKEDLEEKIVEANEDNSVHGIIVYYPVFNSRQDQYLQNVLSAKKDVEGLCHKYIYNMYHNVRFLDEGKEIKSIIPCTPLAIVKILEHIAAYNRLLPYGNRLHGRVITVINRSEVVGRPLAALLANDGAKVFSVDINDVQEFHRGTGLQFSTHEAKNTSYKMTDVLPFSDVVISGVPSANFKVPTELLKDGVIAINFSGSNNFGDDVKHRASFYAPAIGKITIAMLQRNLIRLYQNYRDDE
ncbi:methylenetetrahydrofolate dehydrogenase [NAD(+)] [Folsomia candida]|uniref:methylenetetrahydrofolate dehydrogenase [NAD(+)] n=1 Tax=Folsomia candida TaxID=158441 RepID=UPI000B901483|nr:methylenetetrahydrofolate dehydrogenase [NAD(+)] [Folsomia candida]